MSKRVLVVDAATAERSSGFNFGWPKTEGDTTPHPLDGKHWVEASDLALTLSIPIISGGEATLRIPREMTQADFNNLREVIDINLGGMERSLVVPTAQESK